MNTILAFDVYGTLIDTAGVVTRLRELVGAQAETFSRMWRDKQLEYSFRRGLMRKYETFAVCTAQALDHTCAALGAELSPDQKASLLSVYRTLPAFEDVTASLARLSDAGLALYAFSNGTGEAVATLLEAAGIREHFVEVVSVDEIESFKPDPAVYRHFLERAGTDGQHAWLISGNPFDVIGAIAAGMRGAWVRRTPGAPFDPWGIEPTVTVKGLDELRDRILGYPAVS